MTVVRWPIKHGAMMSQSHIVNDARHGKTYCRKSIPINSLVQRTETTFEEVSASTNGCGMCRSEGMRWAGGNKADRVDVW